MSSLRTSPNDVLKLISLVERISKREEVVKLRTNRNQLDRIPRALNNLARSKKLLASFLLFHKDLIAKAREMLVPNWSEMGWQSFCTNSIFSYGKREEDTTYDHSEATRLVEAMIASKITFLCPQLAQR